MPNMLFDGNNAVTPSHPTVSLQMAQMNQIKIDLMSLPMQAMASPLSSQDWNTVAARYTVPVVQGPQYPTPIWTPNLMNKATQTMEDTVPAVLEENKEENVKENEAPQLPNGIFLAKTSQLEQNEPTPSKSNCKKCSNCSITESCQWRNVTSSKGILCNACFIYQRKYKNNRSMKAIQDYKKRQIDLASSPATQQAIDPLGSLLASPAPARNLAMDPLVSFPATQLASATSTPKRFDISSLLALPTSATPLSMDPDAQLMARPSQLAMEAPPLCSKLAQDSTTPLKAPASPSAQNPTTPKRNGQRKLLEESQKCSNCSITKSCQWRNVKSKEHILCNACFTYQRKYKKNRPMKAIQDYKKKKIDMPITTQMQDDLPLPLISMEEKEEMTRESVQEILDRFQDLADRDAAKREANNL
ncbi:hypothetical protein B9Z55_023432 [Caenorhabditis nigoni]|uniref:GATA-type domain-containing protein n=1 Tax=Caenorhabditis nigoni TaxID=1611254 RepID=A0A2G5SQ47_9PELO|nr:hypothetical protein B9Z55_023432 [Caenorhabditis nigoni]